jgi:hypothetical protein
MHTDEGPKRSHDQTAHAEFCSRLQRTRPVRRIAENIADGNRSPKDNGRCNAFADPVSALIRQLGERFVVARDAVLEKPDLIFKTDVHDVSPLTARDAPFNCRNVAANGGSFMPTRIQTPIATAPRTLTPAATVKAVDQVAPLPKIHTTPPATNASHAVTINTAAMSPADNTQANRVAALRASRTASEA